MAKRPQGKTTGTSKAKAPPPDDPRDAVIDAALARIARDGWRRLSLADVAADAGVPLADVLIPFPTKYDLVNAFQDRIDAAMLAGADAHAASGDAGIDPRDRLFDLMMERFDALAPHRPAMAEIAKDSLGDPAALRFLPRMARTMARVLAAAGLDATGPCGLLRAKGLALVYADAFRVWLGDDGADQAKTMAALDKGLRRAERAAQFLNRLHPKRRDRGPAAEAPAA
jgi:AcrR family transcriptional regulator